MSKKKIKYLLTAFVTWISLLILAIICKSPEFEILAEVFGLITVLFVAFLTATVILPFFLPLFGKDKNKQTKNKTKNKNK